MRAGLLRHRIALQEESISRDAWGGQLVTWVTYATVWANIRPLSGSEREAQQQAQAEVTHTITIRKNKKVSPLHRISYKTRIFAINAVIDVDERNKQIMMPCIEAQD